MRTVLCPLVALAFPLLLTMPASGQSNGKNRYSLFNPKPRELWRPLSADRPDFTESPYTVDAGAVQLEMSFFDYAKNGDAHAYAIAPFNLKLGLLENTDLQIVFDPYVENDPGTGPTVNGIGDTQLRLKVNLWGNDGGDTALAVMPFIKIPSASNGVGNDKVEGGIIVPFATDLAEGVGLGLMFEAAFVYDGTDDDYDTEFIVTGVLGFDVTQKLGAYTELIGIVAADSGSEDRALLGAGLTYGLSEDVVLDVGVNIGLSGDADDVNVFSGITIRF